jgi:hypothetical protein
MCKLAHAYVTVQAGRHQQAACITADILQEFAVEEHVGIVITLAEDTFYKAQSSRCRTLVL